MGRPHLVAVDNDCAGGLRLGDGFAADELGDLVERKRVVDGQVLQDPVSGGR